MEQNENAGTEEAMTDVNPEAVKEKVNEELAKLVAREEQVRNRVAKLKIRNEDVIVIHRLESIDTLTFLDMSERSIDNRRRTSWYGKIVAISPVNSGDDVRESKKGNLSDGDIVIFNPESAYSLNITGFEEIWILHVDSILVTDEAYDYVAMKNENLHKKFTIQQAIAARKMREMEQAQKAREIMRSKNLKGDQS